MLTTPRTRALLGSLIAEGWRVADAVGASAMMGDAPGLFAEGMLRRFDGLDPVRARYSPRYRRDASHARRLCAPALRDDYVMRALGEQVSTASLARDVLAGKPSELDAQIGAMVRHAEGAGVDAPTFSLAYAALLPQELAAERRAERRGP